MSEGSAPFASSRDAPEIVLDLSRLVSRIRHPTPTGVDRVEMAYARELLARIPDRLSFALLHPVAGYGRLPTDAARAFLSATEQQWESGGDLRRGPAEVLRILRRTRARPVPPPKGRRVLIQSSPHHLHRERAVRRILAREQASFLALLHDLIPIEFPEYARPGGRETHLARITTVARLADAVVANSAATLASFAAHLERAGRVVPSAVAHLGADAPAGASGAPDGGRPYFVCLGTIEPRKNHLLLLHLWRELACEFGTAAIPKLLVIGRRGWENEQVVDLLERCPALVGCVEERRGLADREVRALVSGARAVLLPSFAEGFGMPVPEALALGTPVICSDLPALREAGGDAPLFLNPLDGPAWRRAVLAFADPDAPERRAQLDRLSHWRRPNWEDHLSVVLALADSLG